MSGDRRGANIAALEELSRMFSKHSRNLDALIKDLNGRTVSSSEVWWGPRADRFRSAWQEAKTAFDKMAIALEEGSQDIKRSRENIEAATR
ncbi:WXG100 family type VII secretion target [Actinomadura craniellae]|uniref:WXG100 family type VII secretion target n=1 Tax=Actinomadura craniellae TaxID=2231787 RepID=A0A365GZI1_9ACTN|nr:WXG100 family type VII secretion target [Actinomadura craniellae]RAY12178.1 WXG100 family type VII secretion target [Actinomadura craniellae]